MIEKIGFFVSEAITEREKTKAAKALKQTKNLIHQNIEKCHLWHLTVSHFSISFFGLFNLPFADDHLIRY